MLNYLKRLTNNLWLITILCTIALSSKITFVKSQDYTAQIQNIMDRSGTPGIQIAYSSPSKNITIASGVKKHETNDSVLTNTRFQAASLTKVVTSYAFFRLMDKGLIDLDTPLFKYYVYDRLINTPEADKITARMVLTHRTGLLNWEGDVPTDTWRKTPLTLQFSPGTNYMYSGEGFYFLQETIEHITGKPFQQIIEEEVLIPLKMNNSNIVWHDSLTNNAAFGHYEYNKPRSLGKYRKSNAAYTLYTTASDYMTFIKEAIIQGEGLKEKTHQLMLTKAAEAKKDSKVHPEDQFVPCALGLRMQINENGTAYWHTGSNPGFRCFFITYPKSKETLLAFMNSDTSFPAMHDLMKLFLTKDQTFWAYEWRHGELD